MSKTNLKLLAAMTLPTLVLSQQSFASFGSPPGLPNGNFPTWPMQNQQGIPTPKFIPVPFMTHQPNVPNQQNSPNPQFNFQQQTNLHMQNAQVQDKIKIKQEMKPKKAESSFILRRIPVLQMDAPTAGPQQHQQMATEEISGEHITEPSGKAIKWRYSKNTDCLFIEGEGTFDVLDLRENATNFKDLPDVGRIVIGEGIDVVHFAYWQDNIVIDFGKRKNKIKILGWSDNTATWVNSEGKEYFIRLDDLATEVIDDDEVEKALNKLLEKEGISSTTQGGYQNIDGDEYALDNNDDIGMHFNFILDLNASTFDVEFENSYGEIIEFGPYNLPKQAPDPNPEPMSDE